MARPRKDGTGNKPGLPKGSGELANAEAVFEKWYKGNQKVFGHIAEQNKQLSGLNSNFIKLIETLITAEDMKSVAEALKAEGASSDLAADFEPWLGEKSPILNQLVIMTTHLENLNGFISPISKFFTEANENAGPGSVNLSGDKDGDGIPDNLQGGGAGGAGGGDGGGLGGLFGGIGRGAGMAMGGAGVLAGGVGLGALGVGGGIWLAMDAMSKFDGEEAAQNYVDFVKKLNELDAGEVAEATAIMTTGGIGTLFLAFGKTATIAADAIEEVNVKWGSGLTAAQAIKDDIEALANIDIAPDISTWTKLQVGLPLIMTALAAAMAVWGVGKTAANAAEGIETLNKSFGGRRTADGIKEDIETLLSTSLQRAGGDNWGKLEGTMIGLSVAMAVWGAGKGVAGIAEGIDNLASMGDDGRRTSEGIKHDIETLLSTDISRMHGQDWGELEGVMMSLGAAMSVWGIGDGIAGVGRLVENAANWSSGEAGHKTNADAIKYSVETLLSTDLTTHNSAEDWEETAKAISAIGGSMASVGWGHIVSGIGSLWDNSGGEDNVTKIKNTVERLLQITDMRDVKQRSADLKVILSNVGDAMTGFAVDEWGQSFIGLWTGINNWLSGEDGMMESFTALLEAGENIGELNSGMDITREKLKLFQEGDWSIDTNLKEFAQDLKDSVPTMEAAILGSGKWNPFVTNIEGLASPKVDWELASDRLAGFRVASGNMTMEDFSTYQNSVLERQKLDLMSVMSRMGYTQGFMNPTNNNTSMSSTGVQINHNQAMTTVASIAPVSSGMKVGQ